MLTNFFEFCVPGERGGGPVTRRRGVQGGVGVDLGVDVGAWAWALGLRWKWGWV